MTLEKMVGLAELHARTMLIGTKEQLVPTWLVLTGNAEIEILATPWQNSNQKLLTVDAMRVILRNDGATAYSLLVEAWYSVLPASEVGKEYAGPPPSERADRRELVVAVAANHWGQHVHRQWEIVRDKHGRTIDLRPLGGPEDRISSSVFDNLLESKGRPN